MVDTDIGGERGSLQGRSRASVLKARPEVARRLSRVLALRVARGRVDGASEVDERVPVHDLSDWFFERLHSLFNLAIIDCKD